MDSQSVSDARESVWDKRCKDDPQGVIKDLLAQSTRQAKTIRDRGVKIEELDGELSLFLSVLKKVAPDDIIEKFEVELMKKKNKKKKK
tara:strand:+ start:2910 stop:3173 length:264 start_codon:yes stop_codon:yes gene_type:complete